MYVCVCVFANVNSSAHSHVFSLHVTEKLDCCRSVPSSHAHRDKSWPTCPPPYAVDEKGRCINSCHYPQLRLPSVAQKCRVISGHPCVAYGCDCAHFHVRSAVTVVFCFTHAHWLCHVLAGY